jgi:hypothetical protein
MASEPNSPAGGVPASPPNNPPAFPNAYDGESGMALRDWFAGQALAGLVTSNVRDCMTGNQAAERYAEDAYCIADAMLAERVKP